MTTPAEVLDLGEVFNTRGGTFVLRVKGDSLLPEHIADGDFVIVERREDARPGEFTVFLCSDGLRRLRPFPQPELTGARVEGVMVGMLRAIRRPVCPNGAGGPP